VLDVDNACATSNLLDISFDLCFQHAITKFLDGVQFDKSNFVRPARNNEMRLVLLAHCYLSAATSNAIKGDKAAVVINIADGAASYTNRTCDIDL